jgi:hypothetical protein
MFERNLGFCSNLKLWLVDCQVLSSLVKYFAARAPDARKQIVIEKSVVGIQFRT